MFSRLIGPASRAFGLTGFMLVAACAGGVVPPAPQAARPPQPSRPLPRPVTAPPPQPQPRPIQRPAPAPAPRIAQAPRGLDAAIRQLGSGFAGRVGIAVRDVHEDWIVEYNGRSPMPQQSVSKLWVATALLDGVDRGRISLSDTVTVRSGDLTLFNQPIRALVGKDGYTTSISNLLDRAMKQSDNTANDVLLRRAGGPDAVRGFLARNGLSDIRFGPGERLLQSGTAGLTWQQSYSIGNGFGVARAKLSREVREKALDRYLANPPDGASAAALANGLARLKRGEMLSSRSTEYLLDVMAKSTSGPLRLKGGVSPGWLFGHKTGTGQELAGRSTGYNDIALLTAPNGRTYAIAVLIAETRRPIPERMALMQAVTRAVIARHGM